MNNTPITSKDRRFIKYWSEQRSGGKASYILIFSLVGTFIGTIIISVFLFLFFQYTLSLTFLVVVGCAFLISLVLSWTSWNRNERLFNEIRSKGNGL